MPKERGISVKQFEALCVIDKYIADWGFPPSFREIGRIINSNSTSYIGFLIHKLAARGYLSYKENSARAISLKVDPMSDKVKLNFDLSKLNDS